MELLLALMYTNPIESADFPEARFQTLAQATRCNNMLRHTAHSRLKFCMKGFTFGATRPGSEGKQSRACGMHRVHVGSAHHKILQADVLWEQGTRILERLRVTTDV